MQNIVPTVVEERQVQTVDALKSLAIKEIAKVKQLSAQIKTLNDQLKENLLKDEEFAKLSADSRKTNEGIKDTRKRLMQFPANVEIERKKKDIQSELKSAKAGLSQSLFEWSRQTQLSFFEENDYIYTVQKKADVKVKRRKKSRRKFN